MAALTVDELARSRWRGQPGRLEVWYSSITDPVTGTGVWLHHEMVAPSSGAAAFAHGWIAVFRAGRAPVLERFARVPWTSPTSGFAAGAVVAGDGHLSGRAGSATWDLSVEPGGAPLETFPAWAWRQELLPAAQVVSEPGARFSGLIRLGEEEVRLDAAPGASARIYGHGNARSWGWLHADLGDGDVCEVVAAISQRSGLRRLPPLALVKLRLDGRDLPGDPLLGAFRMHTWLGRDGWTVRGRLGERRLRIEVRLPEDQTLDVTYVEPDGTALVCRNSERASATVRLEVREGRSWVLERDWLLIDTAHAEVGGEVCG